MVKTLVVASNMWLVIWCILRTSQLWHHEWWLVRVMWHHEWWLVRVMWHHVTFLPAECAQRLIGTSTMRYQPWSSRLQSGIKHSGYDTLCTHLMLFTRWTRPSFYLTLLLPCIISTQRSRINKRGRLKNALKLSHFCLCIITQVDSLTASPSSEWHAWCMCVADVHKVLVPVLYKLLLPY